MKEPYQDQVVMGSPGKGSRTMTDQDRSALCKSEMKKPSISLVDDWFW